MQIDTRQDVELQPKDPVTPTLVSIVAPVYNEEAVIERFIDELLQVAGTGSKTYRFELILVDDGSRDKSLEILKRISQADDRLIVLELRRNSGQTAALQAGIDHAGGEIIITMDSDLQHFPDEIPSFLAKIEEGWDVVCGWRSDRQEGTIRRWPSLAANWLLRKLSRLQIHDIGTTFRAYRREIISDIRLLGEHHRFIPIFANQVGARITELPIKNIERPEGTSSYGIGRTINVLFDMFFLYFFVRHLDRPIRIFGWFAFVCFFLWGLIGVVLAYLTIAYGTPVVRDHSGWFTLAMVLLLGGLQFILAGITMEMLVRLYFPGGEKSQYHIRKIWRKGDPKLPGDHASGDKP